jgi:lipoate-protein ligase A
MHTIIASALAELNVFTTMYVPAGEESFAGTLCFRHFTAGDLLIGSAKIVGSAQRKQRGALLQHGAILLARSRHAAVLPGIKELSGRALLPAAVRAAIARQFTQQTGWKLVSGNLTPAESQRVEHLVIDKYTQDRWNCKR